MIGEKDMKSAPSLTKNLQLKNLRRGLATGIGITTIAAIANLGNIVNPKPVTAQELSGCSSRLTARQARTRINVRDGAGTNYYARHYGLPGDYVEVYGDYYNPAAPLIRQDSAGFEWVRVYFPNSGASGWIRRDFLTQFRC
jgi:signal peptidase I